MDTLIGKTLYSNIDDNAVFVYLDDFNPNSISLNKNKIINCIKQDNDSYTKNIISHGKITSIKFFVKYSFLKDQAINYKGNIRPKQVYILIETDKSFYFYVDKLFINKNILTFNGNIYSQDRIKSGITSFPTNNSYKIIPKDFKYSTNYDGKTGYLIDCEITLAFHNSIYERKLNSILKMPNVINWQFIKFLQNKKIFLDHESKALNYIKEFAKKKFLEIQNKQNQFIEEIFNVEKYSDKFAV